MRDKIFYRTVNIDGLNIFYREAGSKEYPLLFLLHGFPSSSHMYRDLIADLSGTFHIIAPDYPGFGQSSAPDTTAFSYTFDKISDVIESFINQLQLKKIHLYMQDYGGPVGLRIANRRRELISSLIIQNANVYDEGLGAALDPLLTYIQNPDEEHEKAARFFLSLDATKWQYFNGADDTELISPDSYITDQYYLDRAGNDKIQLELFRDYGSNFALYEEWHEYFRQAKPQTLVIWGQNDAMFITAGADAYKKDLPDSEIIKINGGHCLLEEHHEYISELLKRFLLQIH